MANRSVQQLPPLKRTAAAVVLDAEEVADAGRKAGDRARDLLGGRRVDGYQHPKLSIRLFNPRFAVAAIVDERTDGVCRLFAVRPEQEVNVSCHGEVVADGLFALHLRRHHHGVLAGKYREYAVAGGKGRSVDGHGTGR